MGLRECVCACVWIAKYLPRGRRVKVAGPSTQPPYKRKGNIEEPQSPIQVLVTNNNMKVWILLIDFVAAAASSDDEPYLYTGQQGVEYVEDKSQEKRSIEGAGHLGYGGYPSGYGAGHGYGHPVISEHVEIAKHIPVPIVKAVGVPVPQPHPVAVPHPVPVAVPHPVPVHIPVPVEVIKTIPIPVEKPVPYPVEKPYPVEVIKKVPYPVPKPYPVHIPIYKTKHIYHYKTIGHGW